MDSNDMGLFKYGSLFITSIHFDGDGPMGEYKTVDLNRETYSPNGTVDISKFIKFEFETKFHKFKKLKDFDSTDPKTKIKKFSKEEEQQLFAADVDNKKEIYGEAYKYFKTNVNVICGDTNITEIKCGNQFTRDKLGKNIAKGLNDCFITEEEKKNKEWLVLMSSHKISKHRRGFILKNQQITKSVERSHTENTDADGTILAIKIYTAQKKPIIANWKKSFHQNGDIDEAAGEFVIYSVNEAYQVNDKVVVPSTSEAFTFTKEPIDSLTTDFKPKEKVFIDHSVLYSNIQFLSEHVNESTITNYKSLPNQHLIVLNLNSMVNAGNKNWNLAIKNFLPIVNLFDKAVYDILKEQIYKEDGDKKVKYTNNYDEFNGTGKKYKLFYVKLKPGSKELIEIKQKIKDALYKVIEYIQVKVLEKHEKQLTKTKYLKKEYYEKYIKYKTKYQNLKNT
jgi:hypothetical protein